MPSLAEKLFTEAFEPEVLENAEHTPLSEWNVAGRNRKKSNPNGEDIAWWRQNGPEMVQNWIDWRQGSKWKIWTTPDGIPAIELPMLIDYGGPEPYKAIIDRVFQRPDYRLVVVDLKTGARSQESDMQLGFYGWTVRKQYQVALDLGAYWDARKGELSEVFQLERYEDSLVELWLSRFHAAKEQGIFIPRPTFMCRACSMRRFCTAYGGAEQHLDPDYAEVPK